MRFILLARDPFDADALRAELPGHEVEQWSGFAAWSEDELAQRLRAVDAVVTGRSSPRLPDALVHDRGRLKLLAHCHGTIKHLVDKAHLEHGLLVSNWGEEVFSVAEGAMALTLALLKQVHLKDRLVRSDWADRRLVHHDFPATLAGRDVGVYGYGPIGRHYARLVAAFGAQVAIYDPFAEGLPAGFRRCATLRELFATCQIVSVHCGLNDATRGSVDARMLELLPQGGIVVNTARGAIVDETALAAEVAAGRLLAGIDVIADERAWARSPLAGLDGALLTGHKVASGGLGPRNPPERKEVPPFVIENLRALAEGRPLVHLVHAHVYDLKT